MDSTYSNLFTLFLSFISVSFYFTFIYKGYPLPSFLSPLRYIILFPIAHVLMLGFDPPQMENNNEFQGILILINRHLLSLLNGAKKLLSKLRYILVLSLRFYDRLIFAALQITDMPEVRYVKSFQVKLDGHFKLDEVQVQVMDGYIVFFVIHRKHDLKTDDGNCVTMYDCSARYTLPESLEAEIIKNTWHQAILVETTESAPNDNSTALVNMELNIVV